MIDELFRKAIDETISPRMKNPDVIGDMMFSNGSVDSFSDAKPEVLIPMEENPRVKRIAAKERFAFDADGKLYSKMKQYQLRDAIFEAIIDRFYKDASLIAYGEENRDWGGALRFITGSPSRCPTTACSTRPSRGLNRGHGHWLRDVRWPRDPGDHVLRLHR